MHQRENPSFVLLLNLKKEKEQKRREKKEQSERLAIGVNRLSHQTLFPRPVKAPARVSWCKISALVSAAHAPAA